MSATSKTAITRRHAIAATAAASSLASVSALAQQASAPARQKGPAVWLDMDQQDLDDAYDQSKYAPNAAQIIKRYTTLSEAARTRLGPPKRLAYGPSAVEGLDVYDCKKANAPVHVFLHGGAWRGGAAKDYAYPAEMFVAAGVHYVAVDFVNVVETKGDLMPMAKQCRDAVAWIAKNAASFGGDTSRIYLSGHSSGAHLAGVVATTDWQKEYGLTADTIKGCVLVSGMYDLKPVRLSARSSYVKFTDDAEDALSSGRHIDRIAAPLVVAHGTLETPEFQRQSRQFAEAVGKAGKPVKLVTGEGYNHFEIIDTLANPYGLLGREALAQIAR